MNNERYLETLDRLLQKNRLLGFCLLVMLAFNLMNWMALLHARSSQQVVLVPVTGGSGMWVGNGKASQEYLRAMGRYITGQLGDYDAGSYRKQLEELLLLFPPESVGSVHSEFMKLADEIERFPSISSYVQWLGETPMKIRDNKQMQIRVMKRRLVNGTVTESFASYYCIDFRIDDTQFHIVHVEEVEGTADDLCFVPAADRSAKPGQPATVPSASAATSSSSGKPNVH